MKWNRSATIIAAALVLAVGLGALGTRQYQKMASKRRQLALLEDRVAASSAAADRYRRAAREVPRLRDAHRKFLEQTPYQPDLGLLLERVGQNLTGDGAEREIVTHPVVSGPLLNRTPILLQFKGSADRVFSVLKHIEGQGLLTRIERIRMEQPSPGSDKPLSVLVEFSLFSRASEEALTCKLAE